MQCKIGGLVFVESRTERCNKVNEQVNILFTYSARVVFEMSQSGRAVKHKMCSNVEQIDVGWRCVCDPKPQVSPNPER